MNLFNRINFKKIIVWLRPSIEIEYILNAIEPMIISKSRHHISVHETKWKPWSVWYQALTGFHDSLYLKTIDFIE